MPQATRAFGIERRRTASRSSAAVALPPRRARPRPAAAGRATRPGRSRRRRRRRAPATALSAPRLRRSTVVDRHLVGVGEVGDRVAHVPAPRGRRARATRRRRGRATTSCSCALLGREIVDQRATGRLTAGSRPPDARAPERHRHLGRVRHRRRPGRDRVRRGTSRPPRRRRRRASCAARAPSTCRRARRAVNASCASVHHHANSSPPSPQPSRPNSVSIDVIDSSSSSRSNGAQRQLPAHRRLGLAEVLAGVRSACRCSAQPGPGVEAGPVEEDARAVDAGGCATRPCRRVFHTPRLHARRFLNCHSSSPSSLGELLDLSLSFFSDSCAPYEQQPWTSSGAGSVSTPWQPWPKMQRHDDARNVTSICHCSLFLARHRDRDPLACRSRSSRPG